MSKIVSMETKRANNKFLAQYTTGVLGLILCYFTGYAGYISCTQPKSFLKALLQVVPEISDTHKFFYPVSISVILAWAGTVVFSALLYLYFINESERHLAFDKNAVNGTGGFMTTADIKKYNDTYITPDAIEDMKKEVVKDGKYVIPGKSRDAEAYNMIMSQNFYRPVNSRRLIGNNNVLILGAAGTGKSRFNMKPNIMQMNCSYVVTDPSGEMIYSTGDMLSKHGYKIKIFNTVDMLHSNGYNPFKYVRDSAGVNMLIDCLINNTTGEGNKGDEFFTKAEKLLYSACIFYLRDQQPNESERNFGKVLDLINMSQVDENNSEKKSPLDDLFEPLPEASLAKKSYKAFKQAAGKTLKSILISCVVRLQPFMTPAVRNLTSFDDIELDKIGSEKTALFIIVPQADRTYAFLASMMYSQLFETLYHQGEQKKARTGDERLDVPVRCLMDEFANIGEVPEFSSKLSTMRKYNISATVVLQDMSQLEAMYEKKWREIVGNCSTRIYLGATEQNTLKYFSDMLGEMTITSKSRGTSSGGKNGASQNYQQAARKVCTEEELQRLPPDECIVFTQNMRPVRDKKYDILKHPRIKQMSDGGGVGYDYTNDWLYDVEQNKELAKNVPGECFSIIPQERDYSSEDTKNSFSGLPNQENIKRNVTKMFIQYRKNHDQKSIAEERFIKVTFIDEDVAPNEYAIYAEDLFSRFPKCKGVIILFKQSFRDDAYPYIYSLVGYSKDKAALDDYMNALVIREHPDPTIVSDEKLLSQYGGEKHNYEYLSIRNTLSESFSIRFKNGDLY